MISDDLRRLRDAISIVESAEPLLSVSLPLMLVSEANSHEHWRGRQRRAKAQRGATSVALGYPTWLPLAVKATGSHLVVRIVRIAPRALDSDNLARACKAVRDGVADALGVDDRDPRVTWLPDQAKGKASVLVEVYRGGKLQAESPSGTV